MTQFKILSGYFHLVLILLFSISCATQKGPTGGSIDRTPPEVVFTLPARDSLQVSSNLNKIEIVFSERMAQSTLKRNLYISPPIEFEIDWHNWEEVTLNLNEELSTNQTYVISIASGVQDLQKNNMAESYQFAFSTGAVLDRNSIEGTVHGLIKNATVNLFAYILTDTTEFLPTIQKPLYVSKSGEKGHFKLSYLKNGVYRVLAVDDLNHNLILDADFESAGIPYRDVLLNSLHSDFRGLDFLLSRSDTTAPQLLGLRPIYNKILQVRLSEPVIPDALQSISITDSLTGYNLPILGIRTDDEFDNILTVLTSQPDSMATYAVHIPLLQDSLFNVNDTLPELFFKPVTKQDTTTFRLLSHNPKDSVQNIRPSQVIRFEFSRAVHKDSIRSAYKLYSKNKRIVKGNWSFPSLKKAIFTPLSNLMPDSAYISELNLFGVKNIWGKMLADSIDSHYFTVVSSRELGEMSGTIKYQNQIAKPVTLQFVPLARKQGMLKKTLENTDKFRLFNVLEGKYLLNGYMDENLDGHYSAGRLFPFQFAEPFAFSQDTIKVRKRWETENILFYLPIPEKTYEPIDSVYQD